MGCYDPSLPILVVSLQGKIVAVRHHSGQLFRLIWCGITSKRERETFFDIPDFILFAPCIPQWLPNTFELCRTFNWMDMSGIFGIHWCLDELSLGLGMAHYDKMLIKGHHNPLSMAKSDGFQCNFGCNILELCTNRAHAFQGVHTEKVTSSPRVVL